MNVRLRSWGALPDRYANLRVATSTIDAYGRIVALLVDHDASFDKPENEVRPYSATAVVVDGRDVTEVAIPELDLRFPLIDTLDDGFVVASRSCPPVTGSVADLEARIPRNAIVLGADGRPRTCFHVGTDLGSLLVDRTGDIWIGYGDESSVYAPLRHPRWPDRPPVRTRLPTPGVIRWTVTGEAAWCATEDGFGPRHWDDYYVLNVGAERAWSCPYAQFPFVEMDRNGVRCLRRNTVRSATGLVVAGDQVAFVNGQRTPGDYLVTSARIGDGPVEPGGVVPLLLPDGTRPRAWAGAKVCRDNRMWFRFGDDRTWHVLEI